MALPIRAILLAAGFGTRLRPLTLTKPKCLVNVAGKPLLSRWLDNLDQIGCESVIVNTHYLSDIVEDFVATLHYKNMQINTDYEDQLLGTAGTLRKHVDFFEGSTGILIHSDNATTEDLSFVLQSHSKRPKHCFLTMLTFTTDNPSSCGIVEKDDTNVVIGFHEKTQSPPSNCANGAIYAFDQAFLNFLITVPSFMTDFSTEIIPLILGRIYSCHTDSIYLDIGTPEGLIRANELIS
tara:strand:+ start:49 stop:759 length:711 start_codon:yes stop_codon:yes gene_type:complete